MEFADFWNKCNTDGTAEKLQTNSSNPNENITHSRIMGVSRVENDHNNRAFDFWTAAEAVGIDGCDSFEIVGGEWTIFEGDGDDSMALIRAEMETFMN